MPQKKLERNGKTVFEICRNCPEIVVALLLKLEYLNQLGCCCNGIGYVLPVFQAENILCVVNGCMFIFRADY